MTFQVRDRFDFEGRVWFIHTVEGDVAGIPSNDEIGVDGRGFTTTANYRGRVDTFGLLNNRLAHLHSTPSAPEPGPRPLTGSCRFYLGLEPRDTPWSFDDYEHRVVLCFEDGILDTIRWLTRPLRSARRADDDDPKGVMVEVAAQIPVLHSWIYAYEIDDTFDLHELPHQRRQPYDVLEESPASAGLEGLAQFSRLRTIKIAHSAASDLAPLAGLTELRVLDLESTMVRDLAPLAGLTQLRSVSIAGSRVGDIGPLAAASFMVRLDLRGSLVARIDAVRHMPRLRSLDLRDTAVRDFAPLAELEELTELAVSEAALSDPRSLAQLTAVARTRSGSLTITIEGPAATDPRADLRVSTGFRKGKRTFSPYVDDKPHGPYERYLAFTAGDDEIVPLGPAADRLELQPPVRVRRRDDYIFWLPPWSSAGPVSFDRREYESVLSGSTAALPELAPHDIAAIIAELPSEGDQTYLLQRGAADVPESITVAEPLVSLLVDYWGEWLLVAPPSRLVRYGGVYGALEVGVHGDSLAVYSPELLGLPVWLASPRLSHMLTPAPTPWPWSRHFGR